MAIRARREETDSCASFWTLVPELETCKIKMQKTEQRKPPKAQTSLIRARRGKIDPCASFWTSYPEIQACKAKMKNRNKGSLPRPKLRRYEPEGVKLTLAHLFGHFSRKIKYDGDSRLVVKAGQLKGMRFATKGPNLEYCCRPNPAKCRGFGLLSFWWLMCFRELRDYRTEDNSLGFRPVIIPGLQNGK